MSTATLTGSATSSPDVAATLTSSVLLASTTLLSKATPTLLPTGYLNGTSPSPLIPGDPLENGNYFLNTLIGLIIVIAASALNAFGLNITKLDHTRQQGLPKRERKKEYMRPLWLAGMGMYIVSQLVGSTLALRWLRPDWVAPLGSTSLIFNFLFASWLVGTPVTKTDINGTAVIILGVILILVFSSINHGLQQGLSAERLQGLWGRVDWLVYFAFLIAFTSSTYFASSILARLLASRASFSPLPSTNLELNAGRAKPSHPVVAFVKRAWASWRGTENVVLRHVERLLQRAEDPRVTWLQGIGWAVCGGSLAGMCLVFTKAVVKLLGLHDHPFLHFSSIITLIFVIVTAVLQIVCLNRALECADTVVVVPLFYAGYTIFGFINSLIFYDEATQYDRWVLIAVFLSIAVLVAGVTILSLKSSAKAAPDPYTVTTQSDAVRMRPRMPLGRSASGAGPTGGEDEEEAGPSKLDKAEEARSGREVMWEVGSISDDDDDDEARDKEEGAERRGIGGGNVRGERRGLLVDEPEDGEVEGVSEAKAVRTAEFSPETAGMTSRVEVPSEAERNPFADDDGFGEYKSSSEVKR